MVQVKNLLQFESVSHGLTFHMCCNKLQLRIIHDIDLIPIHLMLSKQSIVKPQETAKRNGASARACSRKGMICSVLVGECNVYSLYMSFAKYIMIIIIIDNIFVYMYIHMFQSFCIYDIYVCINMPGLGDLMIFQEFIIMSSSFFPFSH